MNANTINADKLVNNQRNKDVKLNSKEQYSKTKFLEETNP